jgi:hypothetical protein
VGLFNLVAGLSKSKLAKWSSLAKAVLLKPETVYPASGFLSEPLGHFLMRHYLLDTGQGYAHHPERTLNAL